MVTGAEGKIPGLEDKEEFLEKCGWIPQVLENQWTTVEICHPHLDKLMLHLNEAVDKVLLQDADPELALKEAAEKTNKQIEEAERGERR